MFAIQDEVISTGNYLKYIIKDPNVITNARYPPWFFIGNYSTCD